MLIFITLQAEPEPEPEPEAAPLFPQFLLTHNSSKTPWHSHVTMQSHILLSPSLSIPRKYPNHPSITSTPSHQILGISVTISDPHAPNPEITFRIPKTPSRNLKKYDEE